MPAFAVTSPAPNPFLTETRFSVTLPRTGRLQVEIFDASGRRVRELADGTLPSGIHAFQWSGRDDGGHSLPAGLYWARARYLDTTITQKVLRLR